jgi:hypothetical protein
MLVSANGKVLPMTDNENLYAFIARRERELQHQISALKGQIELIRGQLAQREHELAEVNRIRASQTIAGGAMQTVVGPPQRTGNATIAGSFGRQRTTDAMPPEIAERFLQMTIKELVIQALLDHFPNGGTATEIRDFIRDAYGRSIEPSSLRPQMHRLKADGVLGQEPSTDEWNFRDGKRRLYAMYDHPTSRRAMRELKDDEIPDNEPRTRLRDVHAEVPTVTQIFATRVGGQDPNAEVVIRNMAKAAKVDPNAELTLAQYDRVVKMIDAYARQRGK